jgi:hypothetical protein
MNPLSHSQLGQMTHREYEAKYSQMQGSNNTKNDKNSSLPTSFRLALVASGAALVALLVFAYV